MLRIKPRRRQQLTPGKEKFYIAEHARKREVLAEHASTNMAADTGAGAESKNIASSQKRSVSASTSNNASVKKQKKQQTTLNFFSKDN